MNLYKIFAALAVFFVFAAANDSFHEDRIVIKFEKNSEIYKDVRTGKTNDYLTSLLGEYYAETFVDSRLAELVKKKKFRQNTIKPPSLEIERIYEFTASKNIDPLKLSKTLSSHKEISYAEPAFKHYTGYIPNDSLLYRQQYLRNHFITDAWDHVDSTRKVLVGIVDAGVDYEHVDLRDNIWTNPLETGTDENGNDKRSNGIDDDLNGFVDDWIGWDFVGATGMDEDNDPNSLNVHGTHVAGIATGVTNNGIGIAGAANNGLILPVKTGYDDPNKRNLANTYDGLLYAALMGCQVINCSWGSESYSNAEEEIVKEALSFGPVIVAAAGNSSTDTRHYPSSYDGVLSVSAMQLDFEAAYFTNYSFSVDIAAQGVSIMSTLPGDSYGTLSGTSMASPVVAGVAAMVKGKFPTADADVIIERLKSTADPFVYDSLGSYGYKLGFGVLNALKAVTEENVKGVWVDPKYTGISHIEDKLEIRLKVRNILADMDEFHVELLKRDNKFNNVLTTDMSELRNGEEFTVDIERGFDADSLPYNFEYELLFKFYDGEEFIGYYGTSVIVNKTYITLNANDIKMTAASQGNIAYNDYPHNLQGEGFHFKESGNMMYEGALIVATGHSKISNTARGSAGSAKNWDFKIGNVITKKEPGEFAAQSAKTVFNDEYDSSDAGVDVVNHYYQYTSEGMENVSVITYDIINKTGEKRDSVYAGMYIDWDILPDVYHNICYLDTVSGIAFTDPMKEDAPLGGIEMISRHPLSFFAIDNDGTSEDNPGVYDGFTYDEKWRMLSGGTGRLESSNTDASMVIGAGPASLFPEDTMRVVFLIGAGESPGMIEQSFSAVKAKLLESINPDDTRYFTDNDKFTVLYPHPVYGSDFTMEVSLAEDSEITVDLFDMSGKKMENLVRGKYLVKGYHELSIDLDGMYSGAYLLRLESKNSTKWEKIIIMR